MASKVLTLKYRPQTLDELWVQDHVRDTLKRALERNRLANSYLFCGPRGVGKTTTARILAKSLNCQTGPTTTPCNTCSFCLEITGSRSMDVIEIDGASNRGIEQIRELRENIKYTPSSGRYKVYIIDEVHMLTGQAFNALLKTLEEPPAHAKFIFATTAAHDVPATIVSRCQRFDFRRATAGEIKARLVWLAQQERIRATDAALMAIARRADGAIRDAEGILDQLASFRPDGIHLEDVEELLGLVPGELFFDYADLIAGGDAAKLVAFLGRLFEAGYDHQEFYSGVVRHFRNLLVLQMGGGQAQLNLLPDEAARLSDQAAALGRSELLKALSAVMAYETQVGATQHPRALLEVMSLELAWGRAGADAGGKAGNPSAQDQDRHASAPADQTKPMNEVWRELKQRTARRRSVIGSFLELASPVSLEQDTLAILLPRKHQTAAEQIQADLECLHATLSEIRGRATRLAIQVAGQAKPDPTRERITSVLGDVDEKEPN